MSCWSLSTAVTNAFARRVRVRPRMAPRPSSRRVASGAALALAGAVLLGTVAPGIAPAPAQAAVRAEAADPDAEPAAEPVVFTVGSTGEVDSLNPMLALMSAALLFNTFMYDSVTTTSHDDLSARPGLASSWEGAPDGLTWTYHIRSGLQWSDGKPLTADDAAYSLGRILAGGPGAGTWGNYLESVASIEAPDPETLVLHMEHPNALLPKLPVPIMPRHVLEQYSDEEMTQVPTDPEHVVTSGPFRLVEGTPGGSLYRFAANPDNWRGASNIDAVNYRFFKGQDTVVQALIKGDIDFTQNLSPLQTQVLQRHPGITAEPFEQVSVVRHLGFNTGSIDVASGDPIGDPHPAVLDPDFRYALNTAIDREDLAEKAFKGGATPHWSVVGPGFRKFLWEPPKDEAAVFDPDRSARLLDEAGYRLGGDGTRTMPDGAPMAPLRLAAVSSDQTSLTSAQLVREWLEDLGIPVRVTAMRETKLTEVVLTGNYDMFEWGWTIDDDPDSVLMYFACGQRGLWSDSWYCSEEYEELYAAQKRRVDPEQRVRDLRAMQQVLYRDAPYIVTVREQGQQAFRSDRFHGFTPTLGEGGNLLFDVDSYFSIQPGPAPGEESGAGTSGGAGSTAWILGSGAGIVLLIIAVRLLVVRRQRATAEERE